MVIVDQALADQVLVILDVLVELAELSDLQHNHASDQRAEQQEGVDSACNEVAQGRTAHQQGCNTVGKQVRNSQRQPEAGDHGGRQLTQDKPATQVLSVHLHHECEKIQLVKMYRLSVLRTQRTWPHSSFTFCHNWCLINKSNKKKINIQSNMVITRYFSAFCGNTHFVIVICQGTRF